jgi:hypothetical protein
LNTTKDIATIRYQAVESFLRKMQDVGVPAATYNNYRLQTDSLTDSIYQSEWIDPDVNMTIYLNILNVRDPISPVLISFKNKQGAA